MNFDHWKQKDTEHIVNTYARFDVCLEKERTQLLLILTEKVISTLAAESV